MRQIIKNIYHVGDNECSVYMVDTQSDQGLVLIDAGMNLDMIKLLDLEADILCEGHFGIFQTGDQVRQYIETHKCQNQP